MKRTMKLSLVLIDNYANYSNYTGATQVKGR